MKLICIVTLIFFTYSANAKSTLDKQIKSIAYEKKMISISSEEKIKRIVYLAIPFYTINIVGKDVSVGMCALDRYPVTDSIYYQDWGTNIVATIRCYLGDSSIDNLFLWVYPQDSKDPAKALIIPYTLMGLPRFRHTTATERMQALLSLLPIQSHAMANEDQVTIELFSESVRYMSTLNQYFVNYNSFLKYRTTLASVAIDFVLDKTDNIYRFVQVRDQSGGEVRVSETYDINCGLMEYALTTPL
jgi:hypothetical protein